MLKRVKMCFKVEACRARAFTFTIKILWRVTFFRNISTFQNAISPKAIEIFKNLFTFVSTPSSSLKVLNSLGFCDFYLIKVEVSVISRAEGRGYRDLDYLGYHKTRI